MFRFPAPITMANATTALAEASNAIVAGETELALDHLAGSDSSAVAVLVACRRRALEAGRTTRFVSIPASLASLAKLYGVDQVLDEFAVPVH